VSVVLLRHATAGKRKKWEGDDRLRPLDENGRRQARELVPKLTELGVRRVISSPYVRCVETVEPLAAALGVEVETDERVAEGARAQDVLELAREVRGETVLCTHGDVVESLLHDELEKGAAAVLELTPEEGVRRRDTVTAP
jgi:8-oxo-dGTP diphosphatase